MARVARVACCTAWASLVAPIDECMDMVHGQGHEHGARLERRLIASIDETIDEAHRALRGRVQQAQPWWVDAKLLKCAVQQRRPPRERVCDRRPGRLARSWSEFTLVCSEIRIRTPRKCDRTMHKVNNTCKRHISNMCRPVSSHVCPDRLGSRSGRGGLAVARQARVGIHRHGPCPRRRPAASAACWHRYADGAGCMGPSLLETILVHG